MRLAVVGWAADSGVGRELIDALSFLPVDAAFIFDNPNKPTRKDLIQVPYVLSKGADQITEMKRFIRDFQPTTILTWEVPGPDYVDGTWDLPGLWHAAGIKWLNVVHWDWFKGQHKDVFRKAHLISPNLMCQQELKRQYGFNSTYLPVPVDTTQFRFRERKKAVSFVSVYAYGGRDNRRSVPEINAAWTKMENPPGLTFLAQKYPAELAALKRHPQIHVRVGSVPHPQDLYKGADIAVQPSRYEGVGLSMIEAQACGVPVIAVNAPPMNEVVLPDLLVNVETSITVNISGKALPSYIPSSDHLKTVVENIVGKDITELSRKCRQWVERKLSWNALLPKWLATIALNN